MQFYFKFMNGKQFTSINDLVLSLSQMKDDPFGGDEVDNLDCNMEISDRLKHLIAGLQKNITRIITLSNDDLQVTLTDSL